MQGIEILSLLANETTTRHRFGGVYASDQLPDSSSILQSTFFVVNLDESDKEGSHWVAIHFDPHGESEYFDSYGLPPLKDSIEEFMNSNYVWNTACLQSSSTTVCGQYCVYFIYSRCNGISYETVIKSFQEEEVKFLNDIEVNFRVQNIFGVDLNVTDENFLKRRNLGKSQGCMCKENFLHLAWVLKRL